MAKWNLYRYVDIDIHHRDAEEVILSNGGIHHKHLIITLRREGGDYFVDSYAIAIDKEGIKVIWQRTVHFRSKASAEHHIKYLKRVMKHRFKDIQIVRQVRGRKDTVLDIDGYKLVVGGARIPWPFLIWRDTQPHEK